VDQLLEDLTTFVHIEADLPSADRNFLSTGAIRLSVGQSREEIIAHLRQARAHNTVADLAFHAFRDLESCAWAPFVKAAVERNPVALEKTKSLSIEEVHEWLTRLPGASIYDANRLAQPDELANYGTGDGLEKVFLLANVLRHRNPEQALHLEADRHRVLLRGARDYEFASAKTLQGQVDIDPTGEITAS